MIDESTNMPRCSHCGRLLTDHPEVCPDCAKPQRYGACDSMHEAGIAGLWENQPAESAQDDSELVAIARFQSAAEAGYFAHELTVNGGFEARLTVDESLDTISGYWSIRYVLSVSDDVAESAALSLQKLLERSESVEYFDDVAHFDDSGAPAPGALPTGVGQHRPTFDESRVNWVPIVLTLAAGSVVFWGVRKWHDAQKVAVPAVRFGVQQFDLWDRLATPENPWVQPVENGRGRRTFWIDEDRETAVFREDADGDGHFEKEFHIPQGELVP